MGRVSGICGLRMGLVAISPPRTRRLSMGVDMSSRQLFVACLCLAVGSMAPSNALADWKIPPQVELRVPFEPSAYPGKGQTFLMYELYLTNYSGNPIDLRRIEVLDADKPDSKPVAA